MIRCTSRTVLYRLGRAGRRSRWPGGEAFSTCGSPYIPPLRRLSADSCPCVTSNYISYDVYIQRATMRVPYTAGVVRVASYLQDYLFLGKRWITRGTTRARIWKKGGEPKGQERQEDHGTQSTAKGSTTFCTNLAD
jgi:hypothetical protein